MSKAENFSLETTRELAECMRRKYFLGETAREDPNGMSHKHMAWMLDQIGPDNMNLSKANRWIGYVQAYLVIRNICTLDDVKNETRHFRDLEKEVMALGAPGMALGIR